MCHPDLTHDFLVFIISDFHRYSPSVLQNLSQLALHNDLVLIQVFDKLEEQIPKEKIVITNNTYQINLNGKDKKLNKTLSDTFKTNHKNFKAELEKYNINIFQVNTTDAIEEQLIDVFSHYNK